MKARAWRLAAQRGAVVVALSLAGCKLVLGLDPPGLDPCASGPCPLADAEVDADTDAIGEPVADAQGVADARDVSAESGPIQGLRCGGGAFPAFGCPRGSACCQAPDGAGGAVFDCRASAAACGGGYAILCNTHDDCPGNEVCCHGQARIECSDPAACADEALVCEPDGKIDQCPTGWTCSDWHVNAGVVSPYGACKP